MHLVEICFNSRGRFIGITEFVTNIKATSLIVPECVKGRGREALRKMISLVLECPFLTVTGTKEADAKVENKVGLVWRSGDQSCARVDEGCPRK